MPSRNMRPANAISASDRFWKKSGKRLGKIVVTGANGFIGTAFAKKLVENDFDCKLIARRPFRDPFLESLRTDADLLDRRQANESLNDADSVFHLAGPPSAASVEYSHDRIFSETKKMAAHVADAVSRGGATRLLGASSVLVYPPNARVPVRETTRLDRAPDGAKRGYALGKRCMERCFQSRAREQGFSLALPRFANVYGPLDAGRKPFDAVSFLAARAATGEPLEVYGCGKQTRSFLFIEDCIAGMMVLAQKQTKGLPVNLAPATDTEILSLAQKIKKISHSASSIRLLPEIPAGPLIGKYDVTRAKNFGFRARVKLSDGLRRTIKAGFFNRET